MTRTIVFDCIDLDNPVVIDEFMGSTTASDHNMYTHEGLLYQSNYNAGMRAIDVSDIAGGNMQEVGYFDVHQFDDNAGFNGAWSVYPYFESGIIIVNSIEQGLFVIKRSDISLQQPNCLVSSVSEFELDAAVTVYPNPSEGDMTVLFDQILTGTVSITDGLGRQVEQDRFSAQTQINISYQSLEPGIYQALFDTNKGRAVKLIEIK